MLEVSEVVALAGKGLAGDRYALGAGTYSRSSRDIRRHATAIALDDIETANRQPGAAFLPGETRRNIVVEGITVAEMNALVGQTFHLGAARLRAVEICKPCERPSLLCNKPNFAERFAQSGGLRLEILEGGRIAKGDPLVRE